MKGKVRGSFSHTKKSDLTMVYHAPTNPIGESVSARSSFKSVHRNRYSFDSAVPKIGRLEDQDFKGLHPSPLQYRAGKKILCWPESNKKGSDKLQTPYQLFASALRMHHFWLSDVGRCHRSLIRRQKSNAFGDMYGHLSLSSGS